MSSRQALRFLICLAGLLAAAAPAWANNLVVANTALRAPADGKVQVRFDISWENAWRDGINWDAAWVFVKYSTDGGTKWSHATLGGSGTNPAGFNAGTGTSLEIVVPADKKGAFIQRAGAGTGTVSNREITLSWDFATDEVSRSKSALIKVFAVEMVYIPAGAFWVGNTNGVINGSFRSPTDTNCPFYIDSTNTFTIYWGTGTGTSTSVPNTFPNGYAAFYIMKTEISQRQYCDFLNTLTAVQQGNRHDTGLHYGVSRNYIKRTTWSPLTLAVFGCDANNNAGLSYAVTDVSRLNETNDGEWVACNYLSWADGAAYADWAALRPFTELEFEKACRGTQPPVANEYAWGDAVLEPATLSLVNSNTAAEAPNQGNCNDDPCVPDGPYRCGSYARAASTRANAGAGYYGALDLSGNVWERPVTAGNATGRAFTGEHGDGMLDGEGQANAPLWPGTDATGSGYRGNNWSNGSVWSRVADRNFAAYAFEPRSSYHGWRGARSAP